MIWSILNSKENYLSYWIKKPLTYFTLLKGNILRLCNFSIILITNNKWINKNYIHYSQDTFHKATDQHGDPTQQQRQRGWPTSSEPVDSNNGKQVRWQLHGGRDHEGEVELEVEVGDVPDCRVEYAAYNHPEENTEQTDPPHLRAFEKIQICVAGSREKKMNK